MFSTIYDFPKGCRQHVVMRCFHLSNVGCLFVMPRFPEKKEQRDVIIKLHIFGSVNNEKK